VKSKPQRSLALLITLILLTVLHAMAAVPMLAVVWLSTASFGPAGQFSTSSPWLPVGLAVGPLALMLLLLAAAWLLYAIRRPWPAVTLGVLGLGVPLVEALALYVIAEGMRHQG
jgi:hypothetical protein